MSTPHGRWEYAKDTEAKLRADLLAASGGIENTSAAIMEIAETDKKAWAKETHDYMVENMHPEPIDLMEQKSRLNVQPKIEANEPEPEPSLTPTEKTSALRSVGYAETNVEYLTRQTAKVPSMSLKVKKMGESLGSLRGMIEADPPTSRHSARHRRTHRTTRPSPLSPSRSVTASKRGLSPRARRRG